MTRLGIVKKRVSDPGYTSDAKGLERKRFYSLGASQSESRIRLAVLGIGTLHVG